MVRLFLVVSSLLLPLVSAGCQKGTLLVAAWCCQGWSGPMQTEPGDLWTFEGLDPGTPPRVRPGSYATATHGVHFLGPDDLGPHSYRLNWSERSGIVYTCRAGHIDIAHTRKAADWTGYLAARTLEAIEQGGTEFEFKLWEPSLYRVQLTYPEGWDRLDPQERVRVAREVSCSLGQYLGFTALTWHEILTWFGFRPKGYKSEFPSAFSWEDSYSNLLGTCVAVRALRAGDRDFSESVTSILDEMLATLEIRSAEEAQATTNALRDRWFARRGLFTVVTKRHLDLGLTDGMISPCLVPDALPCQDRRPLPLPVPTLAAVAQHGFSVTLAIAPRVWEEKRILRAANLSGSTPDAWIEPDVHFPQIMDTIATEAVERYGHDIDPGYRPTAGASGTADGT